MKTLQLFLVNVSAQRWPKVFVYSSDVFQKAISFCNADKVLTKMKQVAQPTLKINDLGRDPMRDTGDMATIPKQWRKITPLQHPERFGYVVHFDIVYGSGTTIGGYRYAQWFVDRRSKNINQYPLKFLAPDELLKAVRLFRMDVGGRYPDKMIGDNYFKLIGDQVAADLEGINEDKK